jgi:hypothetical protein
MLPQLAGSNHLAMVAAAALVIHVIPMMLSADRLTIATLLREAEPD